jgi:hypothetical protein
MLICARYERYCRPRAWPSVLGSRRTQSAGRGRSGPVWWRRRSPCCAPGTSPMRASSCHLSRLRELVASGSRAAGLARPPRSLRHRDEGAGRAAMEGGAGHGLVIHNARDHQVAVNRPDFYNALLTVAAAGRARNLLSNERLGRWLKANEDKIAGGFWRPNRRQRRISVLEVGQCLNSGSGVSGANPTFPLTRGNSKANDMWGETTPEPHFCVNRAR